MGSSPSRWCEWWAVYLYIQQAVFTAMSRTDKGSCNGDLVYFRVIHSIPRHSYGLNRKSNLSIQFSIFFNKIKHFILTHWGRATYVCVSKLTIIGSDNDLSPGRRQAIIWTNDGILLIGPLGTNFSEILSKIHTFSFKKMHLKHRLRNGSHFVSA